MNLQNNQDGEVINDNNTILKNSAFYLAWLLLSRLIALMLQLKLQHQCWLSLR